MAASAHSVGWATRSVPTRMNKRWLRVKKWQLGNTLRTRLRIAVYLGLAKGELAQKLSYLARVVRPFMVRQTDHERGSANTAPILTCVILGQSNLRSDPNVDSIIF